MSGFSIRDIPGLDLLQSEIRRTTEGLQGDVENAAKFEATNPADWKDSAPATTVAEALNRIVAAIKAGSSDV